MYVLLVWRYNGAAMNVVAINVEMFPLASTLPPLNVEFMIFRLDLRKYFLKFSNVEPVIFRLIVFS